jgi:hypothetical protein
VPDHRWCICGKAYKKWFALMAQAHKVHCERNPVAHSRGLDGADGSGKHQSWREIPLSCVRTFVSGVASRMRQRLTCSLCSRHPSQLALPPCIPFVVGRRNFEEWRHSHHLLGGFTDHSGRVASGLVDVPISQGPRGPELVAAFHGAIEKVCSLSQKDFQISERY